MITVIDLLLKINISLLPLYPINIMKHKGRCQKWNLTCVWNRMGNRIEEILKKELVKELVGMGMRNLKISCFLFGILSRQKENTFINYLLCVKHCGECIILPFLTLILWDRFLFYPNFREGEQYETLNNLFMHVHLSFVLMKCLFPAKHIHFLLNMMCSQARHYYYIAYRRLKKDIFLSVWINM